MKKTAAKAAAALLFAAALALLFSFSESPFDKTVKKYSLGSEDEAISAARETSAKGLIDEMELLSSNGCSLESLTLHACALAEKIGEISYETILSALESDSYSLNTKIALVQAANVKGREDPMGKGVQTRMESLLKKLKTDQALRIQIIVNMPPNEQSYAKLREIAESDPDEAVAYQAFRVLYAHPPAKPIALGLANKFLESGAQGERLLESVLIKGDDIGRRPHSYTDKEKMAFVDKCASIIDKAEITEIYGPDPYSRPAEHAAEALCSMRYDKALWAVLESDKLHPLTKSVLGVKQNYSVLLNVLRGSPTADDVNRVIQATNLYATKEVRDELGKWVSAHPELQSRLLKIDGSLEAFPADHSYDRQ